MIDLRPRVDKPALSLEEHVLRVSKMMCHEHTIGKRKLMDEDEDDDDVNDDEEEMMMVIMIIMPSLRCPESNCS